MSALALALAGGLGALARALLVGRVGGARGTLLVNLLGAFALGAWMALPSVSGELTQVVGTGFLGAFTTFSTWMTEANQRWRSSSCTPGPTARWLCSRVLLELAATLAIGVLAYALGAALVQLFTRG